MVVSQQPGSVDDMLESPGEFMDSDDEQEPPQKRAPAPASRKRTLDEREPIHGTDKDLEEASRQEYLRQRHHTERRNSTQAATRGQRRQSSRTEGPRQDRWQGKGRTSGRGRHEPHPAPRPSSYVGARCQRTPDAGDPYWGEGAHRRTGNGRDSHPDPLAEIVEGADPPQEDHQEDPDTEVEVLDQETPQTGQPGTPAQSPLQRRMERRRAEQQGAPQEQPQEERATTIYAIEEGQAWQLVVGQAGTKSEPAGGTNEYGAEHVNPILAQKAHQLKMKYPHPGMRPCSTCYGILGEGICRRDTKCELARARKRDKCLNCGERAETCRSAESSCEEPLEAAVCVAATLYERIGHERYIRACPTEDMIDVTTKGRDSMWKGLKPHTVREAEQMTEWDLYHVVHMDTATGRSLVRGTGGTWTMSTRNVPAWIASEYERRSAEGEKTRRPQRRTVALADIIEELSDEESSADEDV